MCDGGGNSTTKRDALAEVRCAVEALHARERRSREASDILDELMEMRRVCNLLELEFATVAAEYAAADEFKSLDAEESPLYLIRHECHMTGHAGASAIRVGEQMATLPQSTAAMCEGKIGFAHLALLASTAEAVRQSPSGGDFDERPLLAKAIKHPVNRFRRDCAHARHAADAARFLAEQVEDVEARSLEVRPLDDGALFLRGFLDPEGGATVRTALEALARRDGRDDDRSRERRLADALVELAGHGLDSKLVPQLGGQCPHLQVTASLETVLGLKGAPAGDLELGSPIAAATVQRLSCDASITRVVLDPQSAIVDVGRVHRVPSGATRRALAVRDGGCVWRGCTRPASWTSAHHVLHWGHGGPTEMDNLVLLCRRHHWMVHEGGWQLVRTSDQGVMCLAPTESIVPLARAPDLPAA